MSLVIALVYFPVREMFRWDQLAGLKAFGQTLEAARASQVLVAGVYGAATASRKLLFVQALPAALGLLLSLGA